MKFYISTDIEGITGINHWDEATKNNPDYAEFREQMTRETVAACKAAMAVGATELYIKDAHETGRNLVTTALPIQAKLIRGWSGHPLSMLQELDASFAAAIMIGYHAPSGSAGNPLSHSMTSGLEEMLLNGMAASEFLFHAYAAATMGVPVVLVSGDEEICNLVKQLNPHIATVAVNKCVGNSTISIHPDLAVQRIEQALANIDIDKCKIKLPEQFVLEVRYQSPQRAYKTSFYPNAQLKDPKTILLECNNFFDIMRFLLFF